ncbi:MAG: hypothetical protein DRG82_16930 [Deltaproteobacteria bacterium]|nr:MAG: hypothetical protein DRG82_16930 [Deltaproteobacteria bacterium]
MSSFSAFFIAIARKYECAGFVPILKSVFQRPAMDHWKESFIYYFHQILNILITVLIFVLLYLTAVKVFKNISSLLNIIII